MKKVLCECGCNQKVRLATRTDRRCGHVEGQPIRFINGHNGRKKVRYIVNENGCWIWQLARSYNGYGVMGIKNKNIYAHRYYYEKYKGKIPKHLEIDHLCRVRHCVNPKHLETVTTAENIRRGDSTKLTQNQVEEIKRLYANGKYFQREIAKKFSITRMHISRIVNNKRWKKDDAIV